MRAISQNPAARDPNRLLDAPTLPSNCAHRNGLRMRRCATIVRRSAARCYCGAIPLLRTETTRYQYRSRSEVRLKHKEPSAPVAVRAPAGHRPAGYFGRQSVPAVVAKTDPHRNGARVEPHPDQRTVAGRIVAVQNAGGQFSRGSHPNDRASSRINLIAIGSKIPPETGIQVPKQAATSGRPGRRRQSRNIRVKNALTAHWFERQFGLRSSIRVTSSMLDSFLRQR